MGTISSMKTILVIGIIALIIIIACIVKYNPGLVKQIDGGRALVIVEPREHKMLKYVCENFDQHMCKTWDLYVFHGKSHAAHAQEAVQNIKGRKVQLIALDKDNFTADDYNITFKSLDFWNQVKAENILVFQTDAVLCPASQFKIQDFMHFDYIGCGSYDKAIGNSKEVWGYCNIRLGGPEELFSGLMARVPVLLLCLGPRAPQPFYF